MVKSRSYHFLNGGLGNQLFQYSFAAYCADKYGVSPCLNTRVGFLIDRKYKRSYSLDFLSSIESANIIVEAVTSLIFFGMLALKLRRLFNIFAIISDNNIEQLEHSRCLIYFVMGDFQDKKYIHEDLVNQINYVHRPQELSCGVYIRTFEEVPDLEERKCRIGDLQRFSAFVKSRVGARPVVCYSLDRNFCNNLGFFELDDSRSFQEMLSRSSQHSEIYMTNSSLYFWIAYILSRHYNKKIYLYNFESGLESCING